MSDILDQHLIPVDPGDPDGARAYFREHAVSLAPDEYARVCDLLGRRPTAVELHIFNTMWSEHCSYKSSRPTLKEFLPTAAPHVVLGPGEDAGIIRLARINGRSVCLVMAHESHNHPSQVLPVEGAATGIGGIVRDVYCMGADVIGVMDPLRFGDPDGEHATRTRDIAWGVVDGIAQYGNALGVPNLGGEAYFDASFDDNCLVNVVAFGLVDEDAIVRSRVPDQAREEPYDVILIGKPTDASGFGGAAFASERLSEEEAVERQGAVQVPDPFLKRVLVEGGKVMLAWARENRVPIGYKDLGAGGISCAVSEMAEAAGLGVHVDLDAVHVAFADLPPEVIACSETQERFLIAVPAARSSEVLRIYNEDFDMPHIYTGAGARVIGRVTPETRFRITYRGEVISDADVGAITTGILYDRLAEPRPRTLPVCGRAHAGGADGIRDALLDLLGSVNISSRAPLYEHYDAMVQGRAVITPGDADACVQIVEPGSPVGLAVGLGSCSRLGAAYPFAGGQWAVVEAVRNVSCVGALPLAITDCLNYGDPEDPGVFWEFREGVRGIGDACRGLTVFGNDAGYGIPVVSGNVSFYNQSESGDAIAPTPVISCAGVLEDASAARSNALKDPGSHIVLLGALHDRIGGSEYERIFSAQATFDVPVPDLAAETNCVRVLVEGFSRGELLAAHDVSHGGVLVAVAEMILASRGSAGAALCLEGPLEHAMGGRAGEVAPWLFSEYGGVVVEVPEDRARDFASALGRLRVPHVELGRTTDSGGLEVTLPEGSFTVGGDDLARAHAGRIEEILYG